MDGYFFLRYLTMCLKIFFPMAVVILPILLPLNAVNGKGTSVINNQPYNVTGMDTLAWSNVSPEHTSRYWAHLILALGVIAWTCYLFHHELMHYIVKRQEYLSHPGHRLKASATSVLITDIPSDLCTEEKLTEHYDDFPGGLRRIWINRQFKPLVDKADERKKFENQLENAETDLIRKCIKKHEKLQKQAQKTAGQNGSTQPDVAELQELTDQRAASLAHLNGANDRRHAPREKTLEPTTPEACESDLQHDIDTKAAWTKYISPRRRQKMRIPKEGRHIVFKVPFLGRLFAHRVDTIYYCRRELARINAEVDAEMDKAESYSQIHSAFLQFNTQKAAHLACQGLAHPYPRAMTKRTLELAPGDINWPNLGLSWWQRYVRFCGFLLLFIILIFIFGLISVFTGILSKVSTLGASTSWLRWINSLPSWLLSFIQGTLPPVIQIIVLSGPLPIFLRMFTNDIQGATTGTEGERSLQLWYFIFLLFELFIVPTISSGLTSVVRQLLQNPASVPNLLATNLPSASNYYFSFAIVQSLSLSASSILQTIRLLNYYVLGSTNSPDSVFNSLTFTNRTRIGSNIPWYKTFAVIGKSSHVAPNPKTFAYTTLGIVYSVIAPLMLLFMLITFGLFWVVIKNNLLYVVRTGNVDGGGLFFPDAINQTFTGIYFMEVCLLGLFFLVRDAQNRVACGAQGIIIAVAIACTIVYQVWLNQCHRHLYLYLPVTMEGDARQRDREYELERLRTGKKDEGHIDESVADDVGRPSMMSEETQEGGLDEFAKESQDAKREEVKSPHSSDRTATSHSQDLSARRASHLNEQQERDKNSAKRILARLNKPLDEARLLELEHEIMNAEHAVGNALAPKKKDVERQMMNDPISKIIMQHNDELEDLDAEERDLLVSVAFTHPVLRETRPSVWIPQDSIGVSDDEVRRTRQLSDELVIDNKGAFFNRKLKVQVDKPPPDMSEFALLMAEL